ncbi:MAG: hypothetical protein IPI67_19670 [Myxococcales bacterium]|nr:hypothetical protein [Myxococcales bacterium]
MANFSSRAVRYILLLLTPAGHSCRRRAVPQAGAVTALGGFPRHPPTGFAAEQPAEVAGRANVEHVVALIARALHLLKNDHRCECRKLAAARMACEGSAVKRDHRDDPRAQVIVRALLLSSAAIIAIQSGTGQLGGNPRLAG